MTIDMPTSREIPALRQLWKQAFGDTDTFLDGFFATGFSFARCRCLHIKGKLAAALYWFDCRWQGKKVAYIYAVATAAAFQGRGLCRALMEDTHRQLQGLGYAGAALVPGSEGLFALYEKLGYRGFCPMRTVTIPAGEKAAAIEYVPCREFDALRRCRLPENAILQEQETTAFLESFTRLCRTDDALFSAVKEKNTLYFQEYLGDADLLGGIIAALGAEKGIVRLPGGGTDTAMYHGFDGSDALPAYLGIPLN